MTRVRGVHCAALAAVALISTPAPAGNTLVVPGIAVPVAKSRLTVTPGIEWNRLGARPGRNAETWTLDGDPLNDLTFYGGIIDGQPLFREVQKRVKPLPRFSATMLLSDVPALFESSYRIAIETPLMTIGQVEPTTVAGTKGVRFDYEFTKPREDVRRKGEAYAAIVGGQLYLISFEAPAIHYFDSGIDAARAVVRSAALK